MAGNIAKSQWQLDNKEWMRARKQEWRQVKASLGGMDLEIKKAAHKYHKQYFLTGEIDPMVFADPRTQYQNKIPSVFGGAQLFFDMWYAPECDEAAFVELFNGDNHGHELWRCRDFLFRFDQSDFSSAYGMLGGREQTLVNVFLPELDYQKVRPCRGEDYPLSLSPGLIISHCFNGVLPLLSSFETNPFNPGQYLWEHLLFNIRRYPELNVKGFKNENDRLRKLMIYLLDFDDREGAHHTRPTSKALREKLLGQLEAKELPDMFLSLWPQAKLAYETGQSKKFIKTGEL